MTHYFTQRTCVASINKHNRLDAVALISLRAIALGLESTNQVALCIAKLLGRDRVCITGGLE